MENKQRAGTGVKLLRVFLMLFSCICGPVQSDLHHWPVRAALNKTQGTTWRTRQDVTPKWNTCGFHTQPRTSRHTIKKKWRSGARRYAKTGGLRSHGQIYDPKKQKTKQHHGVM